MSTDSDLRNRTKSVPSIALCCNYTVSKLKSSWDSRKRYTRPVPKIKSETHLLDIDFVKLLGWGTKWRRIGFNSTSLIENRSPILCEHGMERTGSQSVWVSVCASLVPWLLVIETTLLVKAWTLYNDEESKSKILS